MLKLLLKALYFFLEACFMHLQVEFFSRGRFFFSRGRFLFLEYKNMVLERFVYTFKFFPNFIRLAVLWYLINSYLSCEFQGSHSQLLYGWVVEFHFPSLSPDIYLRVAIVLWTFWKVNKDPLKGQSQRISKIFEGIKVFFILCFF